MRDAERDKERIEKRDVLNYTDEIALYWITRAQQLEDKIMELETSLQNTQKIVDENVDLLKIRIEIDKICALARIRSENKNS